MSILWEKNFEPNPVIPARAEEPAERREHERIARPPLHVSGLYADVEDVSEGGLCLRVQQPVYPGQRFELILTDGLFPCTKELEAEVVWYRQNRVGLRWVDLTPEQVVWLRQRFRAWLEQEGHRLRLDRRPATLR